MKKKVIHAALLVMAMGTLGDLPSHTVKAQNKAKEEYNVKSLLSDDNVNAKIELPVIGSGQGTVKAQLSMVDDQIVFSTQIQDILTPYLSARFFTHEDGIYKSLPYNQSGNYDFNLTSDDLAILRQQVEGSPYASVGIDVLYSDEQIPTAMLYISDILSAYEQLSSKIIKGDSVTTQPFHVGQDEMITGTVDTTGTTKNDTLMLQVNGLGRRLLQIPVLPEDQQSPKHTFEIYAADFVNNIDKKVSIVHIKDGKVISNVEVSLL